MILIITNKYDQSTTAVIEWLDYMEKKWIRINEEDILDVQFLGKDIFFENSSFNFALSEINSVWYRRGFVNINWENLFEDKVLTRVLNNEKKKIFDYIFYLLSRKKNINDISHSEVNKLVVSCIAKDFSLKVTQDYIFDHKEDLDELKKSSRKYISKTISGDSIMSYTDFSIYNYTSLLDISAIDNDKFYPSLIQEYIEKKYELRIFYFQGTLYSLAIFSQRDSQTSIDFRKYNNIKPNRCVPFKLPKNEEFKIKKLMEELKLNSGSIDMIVTPKNEFVFLEVNPIGQFGMVSYPANYNLEEIMANYL